MRRPRRWASPRDLPTGYGPTHVPGFNGPTAENDRMPKNLSGNGVACPQSALRECMNERQIFEAALDIDDLSERDAFVARACGTDTTLRSQLEKLLAAHQQPGDF